MERKEILYCLQQIVKPYVQNDNAFEEFGVKTDFVRDLEINSAHLVDIILDVEDEFNIAVDNASMESMTTVGDAVAIIETKSRDHDRQ